MILLDFMLLGVTSVLVLSSPHHICFIVFFSVTVGTWDMNIKMITQELKNLLLFTDLASQHSLYFQILVLQRDYGTESWSDNMVGSLHGFIIHWIVISKNIKKVTKVIDVKNWQVDNSRVSKWIVSLVEWNSFVSSMKSLI
uniref:RNA-directed DNA polymerase, eukaryota, reverse transcriptase zinc-binding domain protein n=1 Tax=Tanacetum cinerariifolium TaxID=118510 RepID=A0A699KC60_TANCI|nr:hypothetical protein [Tanacetum cinerariifolium]